MELINENCILETQQEEVCYANLDFTNFNSNDPVLLAGRWQNLKHYVAGVDKLRIL